MSIKNTTTRFPFVKFEFTSSGRDPSNMNMTYQIHRSELDSKRLNIGTITSIKNCLVVNMTTRVERFSVSNFNSASQHSPITLWHFSEKMDVLLDPRNDRGWLVNVEVPKGKK